MTTDFTHIKPKGDPIKISYEEYVQEVYQAIFQQYLDTLSEEDKAKALLLYPEVSNEYKEYSNGLRFRKEGIYY